MGRDLAAVLRIEAPGLEHARIAVLDRTFRDQNPNPHRPPLSKPDMVHQVEKLTLYGTRFEHVVGPTKPITGIVRLKGTGRPVAGVTVAGQIMGRGWTTVMTKTDEVGRYRLEGLPKAESYVLTVRPEPGSAYLDARSVVTDTQDLTPIDVPFELPRAVVVRGRILDKQTGRALPCNDVRYIPLPQVPQGGQSHGYTSAADHTFRVSAYPGRGMIVAQVRGRSAPYAAAHLAAGDRGKGIEDAADAPEELGFPFSHFHAYRFVEIDEGAETVTIDLELTPGIIRKGELHGPDGRPVTGAKALGLTANRFATEPVETATFEVVGLWPGATRKSNSGTNVWAWPARSLSQPPIRRTDRWSSSSPPVAPSRAVSSTRMVSPSAAPRSVPASAGSISPRDPIFHFREAVTDREGRFRIPGINPSLSANVWIQDPNHPARDLRRSPRRTCAV